MSDFPMSGSCSKEPVEYCGEHTVESLQSIPIQLLTPLDFTHVVYDASQPHSLPLAYLTFLPIIIGLGLLSAILLRRDLEALFHSAGLLLSSSINVVLKRIIRQPRPAGSAKTGYGMPSDHAQFSFFFLVYFSYWILYRSRLTYLQKRVFILGMIALVFVVCFSRVHLGVHSVEQVLVGAAVGSFLGMLWGAWAKVCVWKHIYPLLERSFLGKQYYFKDCSNLPAGVRSCQEFEFQYYAALRDQQNQTASPKCMTNGNADAKKSS